MTFSTKQEVKGRHNPPSRTGDFFRVHTFPEVTHSFYTGSNGLTIWQGLLSGKICHIEVNDGRQSEKVN